MCDLFTGIITTVAKLRVGSDYNLTVIATDPNTQVTGSTSITIKVMPLAKQHISIFPNDSYTFNITENAPIGKRKEKDVSNVNFLRFKKYFQHTDHNENYQRAVMRDFGR